MAIFHLSVQTGSRNNNKSARAKYTYIMREGRYSKQSQGKDVLYSASANMPSWASGNDGAPIDYWRAADAFERANGRLYNQIEFSLPIELSGDSKIKLAHQVAEHIAGAERLPYSLAIHNNPGNPHCHLMISERQNDGIDRLMTGWFCRHDSANPRASGALKSRTMMARTWIKELRQEIEQLTNRALASEGIEARVDCRSYRERGIETIPTVHEGPADAQAHARRAERNTTIRSENARREQTRQTRSRPVVTVEVPAEVPVRLPDVAAPMRSTQSTVTPIGDAHKRPKTSPRQAEGTHAPSRPPVADTRLPEPTSRHKVGTRHTIGVKTPPEQSPQPPIPPIGAAPTDDERRRSAMPPRQAEGIHVPSWPPEPSTSPPAPPSYAVGDRVRYVHAGKTAGIVGTITHIDADAVVIEVSVGKQRMPMRCVLAEGTLSPPLDLPPQQRDKQPSSRARGKNDLELLPDDPAQTPDHRGAPKYNRNQDIER